MMSIACMRVALELDLFQVWGGVDLVRRTDLVPADRLRIRNFLIHLFAKTLARGPPH